MHRVLSFTRHLPVHGWDCTIVCAGPGDYWVEDASLVASVPADTEVIRVSGGSGVGALLKLARGGGAASGRRSAGLFSGLRGLSDWFALPDSYAGWAQRASRAARARLARGGIDALLTTSPPDSVHLAALALGRGRRVPWIADFRDPWLGLAFRNPPTAWHRARHAALERAVVGGADLVLTASATHLARLGRESGARARRALHLPNGFEPEPEAGPAADGGGDAFVLAFTGTLSHEPDCEVTLEAIHEVLARHPDARRRLRLRVAGPFDSEYEDRSIALGLKGIADFLGPVSHADAVALQRRADLLVLWKPRGFDTMVPGKLYEYLDAGRPVLAVADAGEEAAGLVRRAGGEVLAPGDRRGIAQAIERRWLAWKAGERAPRARPEWLDEHRRDRLAARLAGELDALAGGAS